MMHKVHAERSENVFIELPCRSTRGAAGLPVRSGNFCVSDFDELELADALEEHSSTVGRF